MTPRVHTLSAANVEWLLLDLMSRTLQSYEERAIFFKWFCGVEGLTSQNWSLCGDWLKYIIVFDTSLLVFLNRQG